MAWVKFEKNVLKIADFQQILGVNQQIFQIFGKPNADFRAKKYGNTDRELNLLSKVLKKVLPTTRYYFMGCYSRL